MPATDPRILHRAQNVLAMRRRQAEDACTRRTAGLGEAAPEAARLYAELSSHRADMLTRMLPMESADEAQANRLESELARALKTANLPPDYLKAQPECVPCGDTGYIGPARCGCLVRLCAAEQRAQLEPLLPIQAQNFSTFDETRFSDKKDPASGFSPRQSARAVLRQCRDYAEGFAVNAPVPETSLLLMGRPGTGKTFLLSCIAEAVAGKGFWVHYTQTPAALAALEAERFRRDADTTERDNLHRATLLLLDDFGSEWNTPSSQTALFMLVSQRLNEGRPTAIATILNDDEIAKRYPPQLASRLTGAYQTAVLFGEDLRCAP
jgi:DNA replication protein DnaC